MTGNAGVAVGMGRGGCAVRAGGTVETEVGTEVRTIVGSGVAPGVGDRAAIGREVADTASRSSSVARAVGMAAVARTGVEAPPLPTSAALQAARNMRRGKASRMTL